MFLAAKSAQDGETYIRLPGDTIVSMNLWGFTAKMLDELELRFGTFLDRTQTCDPLKGEYFLPGVVNDQLKEKSASVCVLPCEENWYGVTYREDLAEVKAAIRRMKDTGIYKEALWE